MDTVARPDVNPADPQAATPYFRRCTELDEAVRQEEARRGLPPAA